MEILNSKTIGQIQQLLQKPRTFIEKEFSPYFYRYFMRYSNPKKFDGYLSLCKYLFQVTKSKDASVLDLGCGFGLIATIFGLYGAREVVGYDLNDEKIRCFKKMLLYLNLEIKDVKPVLGDSSKIEYPDEYFDVVIANETFSHIREMGKSIREVYRVLKIGGKFLPRETSGMFGNEIYEAVRQFEKSGVISDRPKFRYRNPMTGEFPEKELNPVTLKYMLAKVGFEVSFIPHFYSASFSDIEMTMKRLFYWMGKYIPIGHLFLTPGFALLGKKRSHI